MGDCDGGTQSECRRSFPVIAFDLVAMVSLRDLQFILMQTLVYDPGYFRTNTKVSIIMCQSK